MFTLHAVEISVEDAGVAIKTEENERIGEGFEERFYGSFEGLVGLGIVVHDQCLGSC